MLGDVLASDVHAPGGAQYEVWRDIDLVGCILARCDIHEGAGTYAAALAWGAVAKWARRDDALWAMVLMALFPFTAGRTSPFWPDPDRLWLAFLCSSFAGALTEVDSREAVFERTLTALKGESEAPNPNPGRVTPSYDEAILAVKVAGLRLRVIRWGRYEPGLSYVTSCWRRCWRLGETVRIVRVCTPREMWDRLDALIAADDSPRVPATRGW